MNDPNTSVPKSAKARVGSGRRSFALLLGLLIVLFGALVVGRGSGKPENSVQARTERIAADIKCPTCQGLSVADSNADSARAIYDEIERQVRSGKSDAEVIAYLTDRYGDEQLLRPRSTGAASVVWIAPVVLVVTALTGLGFAFRRWKTKTVTVPTDEDRSLVAKALRPPPDARSSENGPAADGAAADAEAQP